MILQTKDLIKILPFDTQLKKDLEASLDSLDVDKRNNIESLVWKTYFALYDMKLEENLQIALDEAKQNREKIDENFYKRVKELTDSEMAQVTEEDLKNVNLSNAREQLNKVISGKDSND